MRIAAAVTALFMSIAGGDGADPPQEVYKPTTWMLLHVSRDQRALVISYVSGGCGHGGRAAVDETQASATIAVSQLEPSSGDVPCTADLRLPTLTVRLAHPLDGRRLVGQARRFPMERPDSEARRGDRYLPRVPRLVGVASRDAARALRLQGLRPFVHGAGEVVRTSPRPGRVPKHGRVDVFVRH
jgi:hypothetical protein